MGIKKKIVEFFNSMFRNVTDIGDNDNIYVHGSESEYNLRFKKISISNFLTKIYNYVLGLIQSNSVFIKTKTLI